MIEVGPEEPRRIAEAPIGEEVPLVEVEPLLPSGTEEHHRGRHLDDHEGHQRPSRSTIQPPCLGPVVHRLASDGRLGLRARYGLGRAVRR